MNMRFPAVFGIADSAMRYLYEGSAAEVTAWLKEHPRIKNPRIIDDKASTILTKQQFLDKYGSQ